mgnify:CR=1 FL=1
MRKYKRHTSKEEYYIELGKSLSDYYNYMFWEDMDDFDHYHDCGDPNCWCKISYDYINLESKNRFYSGLSPIDMESFRDKIWKRNKKIDEILNSELDENWYK